MSTQIKNVFSVKERPYVEQPINTLVQDFLTLKHLTSSSPSWDPGRVQGTWEQCPPTHLHLAPWRTPEPLCISWHSWGKRSTSCSCHITSVKSVTRHFSLVILDALLFSKGVILHKRPTTRMKLMTELTSTDSLKIRRLNIFKWVQQGIRTFGKAWT